MMTLGNRAVDTLAAALITAGLGGHSAARDPSVAHTRDCIDSPWSSARDLRTTRDRPIYVDRPAVVPMRNGRVLLLGFPTFIWASRQALDPHGRASLDSLMPAGVMLDGSGGVTVVPYPGDAYRRLWTPRASIDTAAGSWIADVVWAGRPSASSDADVPPTSLWYSRFDGSTWSTPERLYADTIEWGPASASQAMRTGDTLTIVASTAFTRGWHLLLMRHIAGTWSVRVIASKGSGYLAASEASGALVVARVRAQDRPGLNGNSLFVTRLVAGDSTWGPDLLVHRARDGQAHDPQLLSRGDSLWLLWRQRPARVPDEEGIDSLIIAVSADGGASWRRFPGTGIHERSTSLTAILAPDGGVHASYLAHLGDRQVIGYAYWDGAWRRVEDMPGPDVATPPVLAIANDSLWLLRGRVVRDGEAEAPVLTIARRSLHCR